MKKIALAIMSTCLFFTVAAATASASSYVEPSKHKAHEHRMHATEHKAHEKKLHAKEHKAHVKKLHAKEHKVKARAHKLHAKSIKPYALPKTGNGGASE
ncbi:hypothetical protein ACFQZE_00775 [Paenibacillus sp. GCM10027627]|uniref:hypothetical protein n=1 Tax=unclassified Paenibacillus TaxID=185978 RepID=UPI0036387972